MILVIIVVLNWETFLITNYHATTSLGYDNVHLINLFWFHFALPAAICCHLETKNRTEVEVRERERDAVLILEKEEMTLLGLYFFLRRYSSV